MKDKLEQIWNEAVVAKFKVLSRLWPEGNKENHENLSQDNRSPDKDFNPEPPKYGGC
jgi:hypothetical protein